MKQVAAARRWPITDGTVVSSHVESYRKRVGGAQSGRMTTFYQAVVEYSYNVEARDYHSARVSFGAVEGSSQGSAEKRAASYPDGSKVQVHYDPADPSQAVLEVRFAFSWLLILLTVVFLGLAFAFSGLHH